MSDAHDDHEDDHEPLGSAGRTAVTAPVSELAAIRDEIAAENEQPEDDNLVRLQVPERPGWVVVCTTKGITYNRLLAWRKLPVVKKKGAPGGISELMSGAVIISEQCRSIIRNGTELVHQGEPVTFRDEAYREVFDAGDAVEAVLLTFKNDWHVIAAGNQMLAASGFGQLVGIEDDGDEASPTER